MRKGVLLLLIAVLVILTIVSSRNYYLVIEDIDTGKLLYKTPVTLGQEIGIEYDHSVNKEETSEWYQVGDGSLILKEHRYKTLGAGLPADALYDFKIEDKTMVLYNIDEEYEYVIYRTGRYAGHRLIINEKKINFDLFSRPGTANKIYITEGL